MTTAQWIGAGLIGLAVVVPCVVEAVDIVQENGWSALIKNALAALEMYSWVGALVFGLFLMAGGCE